MLPFQWQRGAGSTESGGLGKVTQAGEKLLKKLWKQQVADHLLLCTAEERNLTNSQICFWAKLERGC